MANEFMILWKRSRLSFELSSKEGYDPYVWTKCDTIICEGIHSTGVCKGVDWFSLIESCVVAHVVSIIRFQEFRNIKLVEMLGLGW